MLVIAPGPFLVAGDLLDITPGSGIKSSVTPRARVVRPLINSGEKGSIARTRGRLREEG